MTEDPILVSIGQGLARVTINRPERLNAMDSKAHLALSKTLDRLAADSDVRVLILKGAGERAFSVGRDLKEMNVDDTAERAIIAERWQQTTRLTDRFDYPKPVIAQVRGLALGGGFELALACDIIVASDDATFGLPEAKRGLIPFAGGVHRLPRQVPLKVAMGCLLSGRNLGAARAYALGLVNEIVPAHQLDRAVESWASDILDCAPLSIRSIKQCAMGGLGRPLASAMSMSFPAEEFRRASSDAIEGPRAFAEGRLPRWTSQ